MECEIPRQNAPDEEIRELLSNWKTVAVVGLSGKPERPSRQVAAFLQEKGYRIVPINPRGGEMLGEKVYPNLLEAPPGIEIVNVFRRPEFVPEIVDAAIEIGAKAVWMQEGIVHNAAADKARAAGLRVVMNKCMLKEYCRAFGA